MSIAAKLQLRQAQSLVMTPQLLQSIRLLQLSHLELERFVEDEVERNPLLERPEEGGAGADRDDAGPAARDDADWFEETATSDGAEAMSRKLDTSLENVFPDDPGAVDRLAPDLALQWRSAGGAGPSPAGFGEFDLEDFAAAAVTLRDHVLEQVAFAFPDPVAAAIARDLTESLDEAGYLRADLAEVAGRLGVDAAAAGAVLARCQTFDPSGIFGRDLAECLALQLKARNRFDPAMAAMVAHLDLLARRDFPALRRLCGVGEDDLVEMMAEVRALDPRPGLAFAGGAAGAIVPDVTVRRAADGGWTVELNPEALPRVLVDHAYYARVAAGARGAAEKEFLSDCLQSANWLTRSLDQRARTILKVASEIVRQQDGFLVHGVRQLRPLNLRTVADAIGMHESTVSRVTASKYMLTPRGVFEFRYFFTAAIASAEGGDAHSSEAVRDQIRQLVQEEATVLSDDEIVGVLRGRGIDIARRTVAKYREGMNIPSSVQRRREKKALAAAAR